MFAVKFHKFAFYKLYRVVVPGNTDCLSSGADRFKDKVNDFVQPVPVNHILYENVIVDIVLDNFLIHAVCVVPFRSFLFRRLCRTLTVRQGI